MLELGEKSEDMSAGTHPPIRSIRDALSYRIARMAAINARAGNIYLQLELGLRLNEWRVMGLIAAGGWASFSAIRDELLIDKGQLSRVVRSLVDRGLLKSRPLVSDSRQIILALTAEGRVLHDRAICFTEERNEKMVSVLTAKECLLLHDMLERLIQHNAMLLSQSEST
jgi:DNA-binding MarR family transcriptional regulator